MITRQQNLKIPPMNAISFQDSPNILLLTSKPKFQQNTFFSSLKHDLMKQGEFQCIRFDKKLVIISFYRSTLREPFSQKTFSFIMNSVKELIDKLYGKQVKSLSVFDDYESISNFGSPHLEKLLYEIFQPVKLSWLKLSKTPANKLAFLKNLHEHKLLGHPGKEKLMKVVREKGYYWVGLQSDVEEILRNCENCQKIKKDNRSRIPPMMITDTRFRRFEKIAMDVVDMQRNPTPRGNKFIISLQDNLTKFISLYAVKKHTASAVCEVIITFSNDYELPQEILTDNGTEFCSELMQLLKEELEIKHILCSNYSPQSNGALERSHGKLKEYLAFYATLEGETNNWDLYVGHAKSAYNKSYHSATGFSPHQLVFGEKPRLPILDEKQGLTYKELHFKLCDKLRHMHDIARDVQLTGKLKTKERYEKRVARFISRKMI